MPASRLALAVMVRKAVVLTLGMVLVTAAACKKKPAVMKRAKASTMPDSADQMGFGMRHVLTNKGVSNGELLSDTSYLYEDGTRIEMRRVNLTFYTAPGPKDGVLTSKTGTKQGLLNKT